MTDDTDNSNLEDGLFQELYDGKEFSLFSHYEPFDVPPRPEWLIAKAKADGVELSKEGNEFQVGYLLDTDHFIAINQGGYQVGKSIDAIVESVIMSSGNVPISLRYEKGVDTGVKRIMSPENIDRWGLQEDGTCGNIIGVGVYPKEKIPSAGGRQIWVCTFKEAREKYWIPKLKKWMPEHALNKSRGVDGYSEKKSTFFFNNDNLIGFITYEQDYRRVQAEKPWMIVFDEEPVDRRFYTAAIGHCKFLRMTFTPINGLSWSYHDLYMPVQRGETKNVIIRHCSQYDSPYHTRKDVDKMRSLLKPYEIKAQVWGIYSAMEGKPYYRFKITEEHLRNYIPRHTLATIKPLAGVETAKEAMGVKMQLSTVESPGPDVWEIYEEYKENGAYWLSADVAEGSDKPEEAADKSAAYIRRLPIKEDGEDEPVMVAALHSTMRNIEFAWACLYAAIHYNYCLMAPEATGEDGAVFVTAVRGYLFMYQHIVISDVTNRQKKMQGFETTGQTRKISFDLVGSWLYDHDENSKIYHKPLLEEVHACIVGKKGRADHTKHGSTDCIVAYGISEYVRNTAIAQIRNNGKYRYRREDEKDFGDGLIEKYGVKKESRPILGSRRGMDTRQRERRDYGDTRKQQLGARNRGNPVRQTPKAVSQSF